ncbi:hypothetical protein N9I75_01375 [Alphaproteobacteria bacterium]|nr:hypothetical protein [Alphaproteobacteria bacterium]
MPIPKKAIRKPLHHAPCHQAYEPAGCCHNPNGFYGSSTIAESHELFKAGDANVLASLKSKLLDEIAANSDYRIIEPPFTSVLQACGVAKTKQTAVAFLNTVIGELIANGGLENSLDQHDVAAELSLSRVQAV